MKEQIDRFCNDLQTQPLPGHKILVTGATGYVGGELVPELMARGYQVRVMVRRNVLEVQKRWPGVEIVQADVLVYDDLKKALKEIQCAYYLIHSLHLGRQHFMETDQKAAINFRKAAVENGLERIIYLGGLGNSDAFLSDHLRSRLSVGTELQKGKTPVTILRSAVIIGAGSISYKMIRNLVRNCPIFLFPTKANSNCQPIAIRDVVRYLVGSLENIGTTGNSYDIGGQDVLSYKKMLKIQATLTGKKRLFLPSFVFSLHIYSRIISMFTQLPFELIKCLMASCVNHVVCQNTDIREAVSFEPLSYKEAVVKALDSETNEKTKHLVLSPPSKSSGILSDIKKFFLHKSRIPTLVKFNSEAEKQNYNYRILQRLDIKVSEYRILNIHKIGVNAPAKYVFEELLKWNGDSTCWPNHIAEIVREDDHLESLFVYLFGWKRYPSIIRKILSRWKLIPLFKLNAIHFQKTPDPSDSDNARYLLYQSYGGYPIGVFTMYVRSSIESENEPEQSQLFLMVGFNFYGKDYLTKRKWLNRPWEMVHDRVTSNVVTRIKQLCEWRFEKIQAGSY